MKSIKRVYVAGPMTPKGQYSSHPAIDYIISCREMTKVAKQCLLAGFDPFVPSFDAPFWWVLNNGEYITEAMIKRYSKSWLEVCDAVVLCPHWRVSTGTLAELELAKELDIPIFESLDTLIKYVQEDK